MRNTSSCQCKQTGRQSFEFIGPISLQPCGQWSLRVVCGVAALVDIRSICRELSARFYDAEAGEFIEI
jgi:hypothetical protein